VKMLKFYSISEDTLLASVIANEKTNKVDFARDILNVVIDEAFKTLHIYADSFLKGGADVSLTKTPKGNHFIVAIGHDDRAPYANWGVAHCVTDKRIEFLDQMGIQRNFAFSKNKQICC
jgi:hypothetical protein